MDKRNLTLCKVFTPLNTTIILLIIALAMQVVKVFCPYLNITNLYSYLMVMYTLMLLVTISSLKANQKRIHLCSQLFKIIGSLIIAICFMNFGKFLNTFINVVQIYLNKFESILKRVNDIAYFIHNNNFDQTVFYLVSIIFLIISLMVMILYVVNYRLHCRIKIENNISAITEYTYYNPNKNLGFLYMTIP